MAACLVAVEASKASRRTRDRHGHGRCRHSRATAHRGLVEARCDIVATSHADVAELVDARRSGRRVRKDVEVRVLSSAPFCLRWNQGPLKNGGLGRFGACGAGGESLSRAGGRYAQ